MQMPFVDPFEPEQSYQFKTSKRDVTIRNRHVGRHVALRCRNYIKMANQNCRHQQLKMQISDSHET